MATKPAFDPDLAVVYAQIPKSSSWTHEDVLQRRKLVAPMLSAEAAFTDPEITHQEIAIPGSASDIPLTIVHSKNSAGGLLRPAFYFIHGGGMVLGTRYFGLPSTYRWIKHFDAVLVSVEYRLAPEHPSPANLDDCYTGLEWVNSHTTELGIDPDRLIIVGLSAGAGLAAGISLMARDREGPKLRGQLLMCPMIDDTDTISGKQFWEEGLWNGKINALSWEMLLPGKRGTDAVSIYAAPSRAKDLSNLPPAFIDVGSAEPFRDENVAYASRLWECGSQAELHVWPGGWHEIGRAHV